MVSMANEIACDIIIIDGQVDLNKLENSLNNINVEFKLNSSGNRETMLNGVSVESEIRDPKVSNCVSLIGQEKIVRVKLVDLQKKMASQKAVVMDGRDIGTVVIPDAELKIFLTADVDVRTNRRYLELQEAGHQISKEEVRDNLVSRDEIDSTRVESPLKQADDAIVIDNSNITREEQLAKAMELARQQIDS